jgi:hypothetical protein
MTNPSAATAETGPDVSQGAAAARLPYCEPQLELLGDLRALCLGGSPGVQDSGSSRIRKPLGR